MKYLTRGLLVALAGTMVFGMIDGAAAQVRPAVRANVNAGGGWRLFGRRPWYYDAGVRRQLKIDDNQYNTLNKNYVQYWTPYNQAIVGIGPDVAEQQRQQQIAAAYGTFNSGLAKANAQVFTDPALANRYNQLQLQYQGYGAFNDPTVQTRLKLNDEQRQKFNQYYTDWNKQMNTYADEYAKDRTGVNKQFQGNWKQTRENINQTLTPEQRKSWSEMTGEAYDFPADAYFDHGDEGRDNQGRGNPPRGEQGRDNPPRGGDQGRDNPPRREDPPRRDNPPGRDNPPRNPAPGAPAPAPAPAPANPR